MLHLAPGRRDVGVPALRHPAARELDRALVERRLELQEEDGLLDVEDLGHEPSTVAGMEPWIDWVRRLQAVSETGLAYASDPYDVKRYEEVARLASEVAGRGDRARPPRRRAPDPEGRRARRARARRAGPAGARGRRRRLDAPGRLGGHRRAAEHVGRARVPRGVRRARARGQADRRPRPRPPQLPPARAPHPQALLPLRGDRRRRTASTTRRSTRSAGSGSTTCRRCRPGARCAGRSSSRSRTRRGPTCPRPSTSSPAAAALPPAACGRGRRASPGRGPARPRPRCWGSCRGGSRPNAPGTASGR